jgi:hypothetical protein
MSFFSFGSDDSDEFDGVSDGANQASYQPTQQPTFINNQFNTQLVDSKNHWGKILNTVSIVGGEQQQYHVLQNKRYITSAIITFMTQVMQSLSSTERAVRLLKREDEKLDITNKNKEKMTKIQTNNLVKYISDMSDGTPVYHVCAIVMVNQEVKDEQFVNNFNSLRINDEECITTDCKFNANTKTQRQNNDRIENIPLYNNHNTIPPELNVKNALFEFLVNSYQLKYKECYTRFFRYTTLNLAEAREGLKKYIKQISVSANPQVIELCIHHDVYEKFYTQKVYSMTHMHRDPKNSEAIIEIPCNPQMFNSPLLNAFDDMNHLVTTVSFVPYLKNCGWFQGNKMARKDSCAPPKTTKQK